MVIITRVIDIEKVKKAKGWKLVYGRRKTGKSFLIHNFINWDEYFFVKRGGDIFDEKRKRDLNYASFVEILRRDLEDGKKIVVDEFHRLPEDFLDFLHINSGKGKLILISSTLWLIKRLLERDSPILGLFSEVPISLIDERDIVRGLKKMGFKPEDIILLGTYMREPIMLRYLKKSAKALDIIADYYLSTKYLVPFLISSVFQEEDKELTQTYEGCIRAISFGKRNSKEITDFLYSRGLIKKAEHGYVQQYLSNLIKLGIIKAIPVFGKKRNLYFNVSPMVDLYFYLDEKYNFSEIDMPKEELKRIISEVSPHYVEDFIRDLYAKVKGLKANIILSSQEEVDIALSNFRKLVEVAEVKWKKKIKKSEIDAIERKLGKYEAERTLIVPSEKSLETLPRNVNVITAKDLIEMAKRKN